MQSLERILQKVCHFLSIRSIEWVVGGILVL